MCYNQGRGIMSLNLIDYVNNKTDGKYYYLKLSEVLYDKKEKRCYVNLIYPQDIDDLSQNDKDIICRHIANFLGIKSALDIKIKKSYMDENLILKSCIKYFFENTKSISPSLNEETIHVSVDGKTAHITIDTNKHVAEYLAQKDVKIGLQTYLNAYYCGNFLVDICDSVEDEDSTEFLAERQKRIEEISYATAFASNQNRRYEVYNIRPLFGDEIDVLPEHIVEGEADDRVFAGRIKYLTQRTYKKMKLNKKTEQEEEIEKPYFTFVLQDGQKSMNASYFPTKANYHKMNLLEDGMTVLIKGNVKLFREKFSLSVKAISLCEIGGVNNSAVPMHFKKAVSGYNFISPEPYIKEEQDNLFDDKKEAQIPPKAIGKAFVVFDLETTGLNPAVDEIIEIGAVKIVDGKLTETFSCFVKPSKPIPAEATAINNITNAMVAGAYRINQVFPDFYKFCEGATLVGHNAIEFDCKFLDVIAKKMGYKLTEDRMDTLMMSRSKLSELRFHNLKTICGYLGIELVGAHRAVNDTIATAQVFLRLL